MNFEQYSERSRGFLQAAQTLAQRRGHQRLTPEHLLYTLAEDPKGLVAGLLQAAGGDAAKLKRDLEAVLEKLPRVEGSGAGQVFMAPELSKVFEQAEKLAEKSGDTFVTVERLLGDRLVVAVVEFSAVQRLAARERDVGFSSLVLGWHRVVEGRVQPIDVAPPGMPLWRRWPLGVWWQHCFGQVGLVAQVLDDGA